MWHYRGWDIYDNGEGSHPVTGRFRAKRFGVGMGHGNLEGLKRMIDTRVTEEQAERDRRAKDRS